MEIEPSFSNKNLQIIKSNKKKLSKINILVVGAGGIGCELLKFLVMSGFKNISIVDMDKIEISNLNRQFLFDKTCIGKYKSEMAVLSIKKFRKDNSLNLKSYVGNIKDKNQFNNKFFSQFDIILNALDNIDARYYINIICMKFNIPLIDSGTTGFKGTVVWHIKNLTQCYACIGKIIQKQIPICTIRLSPEKIEHCVAWAKALFERVFCEGNNIKDNNNTIENKENGINENNNKEIENKENKNNENEENNKIESEENKKLEDTENKKSKNISNELEDYNFKIYKEGDNKKEIINIMRYLFYEEIFNLKNSLDIGKQNENKRNNNEHIQPIDIDKITEYEFLDFEKESKEIYNNFENDINLLENENIDTKTLISIFFESYKMISLDKEIKEFNKDDEKIINFIFASSNLRAMNFSLKRDSKFKIKQIAGNIIPAISSTNNIISSMQIIECLKYFLNNKSIDNLKSINLSKEQKISSIKCNSDKINIDCPVCSSNNNNINLDIELNLSFSKNNIGDLINLIEDYFHVKDMNDFTLEIENDLIYQKEDNMDEIEAQDFEKNKKENINHFIKNKNNKIAFFDFSIKEDNYLVIVNNNDLSEDDKNKNEFINHKRERNENLDNNLTNEE